MVGDKAAEAYIFFQNALDNTTGAGLQTCGSALLSNELNERIFSISWIFEENGIG